MEEKPKRKWIPLASEVDKSKQNKKPDVDDMRPLFFKDWCNERTLSDLVIHTSRDPDARKYYCHKFIISCSCPILYEKLMATKFESTSEPEFDHVVLVDPLTDKHEQIVTYFFQVLYDANSVQETAVKPHLSNLAQLYKTCGATDMSTAIMDADGRIGSAFAPNIDKYCPTIGQDTPLSDITLYFNKEKSIFIKTHRIVLANFSSYFKGLFMSGMKDSTTREAMISFEYDVKPEEIAAHMQTLLSFVYDRKKRTLFLFAYREAEEIIAMNSLASKYFFEEMKATTEYYLNSHPAMNYIQPALKHENQVALMSATKALVEVTLSVDLTTLPVDYLNVVRYTDNQNLFHAIVENQFQPGSEPRIRQIQALQKHLGSAAQIKVTDLDDNNNNCIHYACADAVNNHALIALLIKEKLDVNAVNKQKEVPLEIALQSWVKTSYIAPSVYAERKRKHQFFDLVESDSASEDGEKEGEVILTALDELLMAGAKLNLSDSKENFKNLRNLLCYASYFGNSGSAACWNKIRELLLTVPKEKIFEVMDREYIYLFLQQKHKFPIKFFFEELNLPYKVKAECDKKETFVEVRNTAEITFNGKAHKVKGMKVLIETSKLLTRNNAELTTYLNCTVSDGIKKYKFEYGDEVAAIFTGLVSYVCGRKHVKEKVVSKK